MQRLKPLNFKHLQTDSPAYAAIKQYMRKNIFCSCSAPYIFRTLTPVPAGSGWTRSGPFPFPPSKTGPASTVPRRSHEFSRSCSSQSSVPDDMTFPCSHSHHIPFSVSLYVLFPFSHRYDIITVVSAVGSIYTQATSQSPRWRETLAFSFKGDDPCAGIYDPLSVRCESLQ